MLQSVFISQLPLLGGTADIILLVLITWGLHERVKSGWEWAFIAGMLVSFLTAVPLLAPLIGYLLVMAGVRLLQRVVWRTPILALFVGTFLGSILYQFICLVALKFTGQPIPLTEGLMQVVLPGTLINLLLCLPVYSFMKDLADWFYPEEVEV